MAGNKIRGITIEIAGDTSKLSESLRKVDDSLKSTQKQLSDVNRLLKLDPKNTELLRQKQELLNKAIDDSKKKVDDLKAAQAALGDRTENNATQYDAIEREIIACEQAQTKWKNQLDDMEPKAVSIKEKFAEIADKTAAVGEKFKTVGDGIANVGKSMTTTVSAPIVGFFTLASKGASDLEENLNKVDVAFGEDSQAVKDWADNATTQFGLSKNSALEMTSLFGDMGTAMGLTTGDAASMSTNLAGLAGDLSSFKNIDINTAMNALKGVFTGETESLKGLGIIMNQTNLKQFAEDSGLVYDKLSQTELVTLRYNYVLENTKNAQGDYARTSDGTANSIRTLQATVSNLTAELGSALLPIITPIIQKITEVAKKFSGLDEGTKNTIVTVGLVVAAIGPLLTVIGTVISSLGTIMTMLPALTGPVGLVVVAIGAAIAAGVALYKNWDTVSETCKTLLDNIKKAFSNIQKSITTAVQNALKAVQNAFNNIKTAISNAVNNVLSTVTNVFNRVKSTIQSVLNAAVGVVSSAVSSIKSLFNFSLSLPAIGTSVLDTARSAVSGAVDAIRGFFNFSWSLPHVVTSAVDGLYGTVSGIVSRVKGLFNFSWSLPTLKVPHVTVDGGAAPWGIGGKGRLPSFDVRWYRKAYDNAVLFRNPTILPTLGGLKGFGDGAGSEMVIGTNKLLEMMNRAGTTDIDINVYAAQGMSETAIADAVAVRLDRWLGERL